MSGRMPSSSVYCLLIQTAMFFENLKNAILEYYMSANNNHLGMDNEFQLIYSVNGAIGMMLEWIKREFPYDTKEFAKWS